MKKVIIPSANYQEMFEEMDIEVICADMINDVVDICFGENIIPDILPSKCDNINFVQSGKVNAKGT